MYGFQAITANNGWSMAVLGALIDFTGLCVLSVLISQMHKFLEYWENRNKKTNGQSTGPSAQPQMKKSAPDIFPIDIIEVAKLYTPLMAQTGQSFQLTELYRLAKENNFPHPHLTIKAFREEGILISEGDGIFTWNQ